MPLSKKRNRDRMRRIRLHALLLPPQDRKSVQLKHHKGDNILLTYEDGSEERYYELDADGHPMPEYT